MPGTAIESILRAHGNGKVRAIADQLIARVGLNTEGEPMRNAGGRCGAAYFKSGARTKTSRGEEGLNGTIANAGITISGQLVLNGARAGQFIDPTTDGAIMLFDPRSGERLNISPVGAPALGWPDVTLELCPGSQS